MADITRFLTYYIVLTDPALVAQLQAQFPDGYQYAPATGAAVAFGAPWAGSFPGTDPSHAASGTYFGAAPYTWAPEWTSANNYDATVATFQRKSGGFWGLGGTTVRYYWVGKFVLAEAATPTVGTVTPPTPQPPPARRFVEGFEFGGAGIYNNTDAGGHYSRDASRHVGGFGLALRGPTNNATFVNHDAFGAALKPRTWERFYIRLRKADPTQTVMFWGTHGNVTGGEGVLLAITSGGQLALYSSDSVGARTLLATGPELRVWNGDSVDDGWNKIDVLLRYNPNEAGPPIINTGSVRVYLNGSLALVAGGVPTWDSTVTYQANDVVVVGATTYRATNNATPNLNKPVSDPAFWTVTSVPTIGGLATNQNHKSSFMGTPQVGTSLYLDIDDWMAADWPGPIEALGGPRLTGPDWLLGTKIVAARPKALGANHANWTGDLRILMQNPLSNTANSKTLTSSVSGAIAEVDLDVDQCVARDEGAKGVLSFMVHAFTTKSAGVAGTLGYLLNGSAAVMTAIVEGAALTGFAVLKSLADGVTAMPPYLTTSTLTARKTKGADVNPGTIAMLAAQIELVGVWALEDYRTTENGTSGTPTFPRYVGQHNAPYDRSIFAKGLSAPPPNSPVVVVAGSYVGNNAGQDITFRTPPHFVFIRPVTGDAGGFKWWSTMGVAHKSAQSAGTAHLARLDQDTTFVPGLAIDVQQERYRMRIAGDDTQINAVGVTYEYVAFSDPGGRFCLCGQMSHLTTQADYDNNLINPSFTPEAGFFFAESFGASGTTSLYFKGLGTAADSVMQFTTTAQIAASLVFAQGKITSKPAFHALNSGISFPFALFRRADGNNDPGQAAVLALANWTGDGTASRTIGLAPASGKRPIFAAVFASDNGGAFFRDPSHATTHSCKDNGTDSTTGITGGGIDSLSVGVSLNAAGVTYSAFILIGDTTAGNGGFGVNGEYEPVDVAPPVDGPYAFPTLADFVVADTPAVPIVGEPDLDEITVLSDTATSIGGLQGGQKCEYYTRHIVNMALSRIGVSKRITNIATDVSMEAVLARSHILEDVNQVLRDFDWPFATRYANLVLVGGTATVPVNADWQYSYRAPNAMMKARRLCNQDGSGRVYDRNPPKFILGSDATGPLLYTNEAATSALPLVLEYTVRSVCPALFGDSLFREALAWKFAFSLAPVLAKDTKKQDYCRAMYVAALGHAKVPAAQERQQAPAGDADWINDRDGASSRDQDPWNRS